MGECSILSALLLENRVLIQSLTELSKQEEEVEGSENEEEEDGEEEEVEVSGEEEEEEVSFLVSLTSFCQQC